MFNFFGSNTSKSTNLLVDELVTNISTAMVQNCTSEVKSSQSVNIKSSWGFIGDVDISNYVNIATTCSINQNTLLTIIKKTTASLTSKFENNAALFSKTVNSDTHNTIKNIVRNSINIKDINNCYNKLISDQSVNIDAKSSIIYNIHISNIAKSVQSCISKSSSVTNASTLLFGDEANATKFTDTGLTGLITSITGLLFGWMYYVIAFILLIVTYFVYKYIIIKDQ